MGLAFDFKILPRETMQWEEFCRNTPPRSIALDGAVLGGPNYDEATLHVNFDHHDNVVREATMSTAKQVYFAIKGGIMKAFGSGICSIYINDTDQDTAFAAWLLTNHKQFEGAASNPLINRLLDLDDKWDITGGAFPLDLSDRLVRQHNWVFEPYTNLRKSGRLATADADILRSNLSEVCSRLTQYQMGYGGEKELDTRHEILFDSPTFKIVDEIGGSESRYHLFSNGMDAFISIVARRPDGRFVYTVGRRSRYIPFPVKELYAAFNEAEGMTGEKGWNGSDIIGGSHRELGSGLSWEQLRDITLLRKFTFSEL
ncbi:MAG TPA: hypothetical protein VLA04_03930 [Verrucomicrobiae bacterium]|nr:hypothetical protein [Verrucomicrobiae bacterium]